MLTISFQQDNPDIRTFRQLGKEPSLFTGRQKPGPGEPPDYSRYAVRNNPKMRKAWEESCDAKWDDPDVSRQNQLMFAMGYARALEAHGHKE